MYQELCFYVDLVWEKYAEDQSNYLKNVYKLVAFAYQHKATVYYNKEQIDDFVNSCEDLDSNFSQSNGNILALILSNALPSKDISHVFELVFAQEHTCLNSINNKAIAAISPNSKTILLSFSEVCEKKALLFAKSNVDFVKIEFEVMNELESILKWIIEQGPKRIFNYSNKHGENGDSHWPDASPLLCDRTTAQELLDKSVPDFTQKGKQLYCFDTVHGTFVEFYYEGNNPQNKWHGFHIKIEEWETRVPKNVLKFFGKYRF